MSGFIFGITFEHFYDERGGAVKALKIIEALLLFVCSPFMVYGDFQFIFL